MANSGQSFVRREYPVEAGRSISVRVRHAVLEGAPCVVLEQEDAAFGGGLFSAFASVAELYEVELRARRVHPGPRLKFLQCRVRQPRAPQRVAGYEEVVLEGVPGRRYARQWLSVAPPSGLSGSSPTPEWPGRMSLRV